MNKNYYIVHFTRTRTGEQTYGFVRAWSAETAKHIVMKEMKWTVEITDCKQVSKDEYQKAMAQ